MNTPFSFRSNSLPNYLAGAGLRFKQKQVSDYQQKQAKSESDNIKKGRISRAQFDKNFPDALNHGQGNYEDTATGEIWESRDDGFIYRRDGESIRDILQAINDNQNMSDEEYNTLIAKFRDEIAEA